MKSAWLGIAVLLLLPYSAAARPQQDESGSVADAARHAREQKKEQARTAKVWDNDTIPKTPGAVSVVGQQAEAASAAPADDSSSGAAAPAATNAEANAANPGPSPAGQTGGYSTEAEAEAASAAAAANPPAPAPAPAAEAAAAPAPAAPAADEKSDRDKLAAEIAGIQSDLTAARARLQTLKADLDLLQRKYNLDSQTYYSKPNYSADKDGAASIAAEKQDVEAKQQEVADAQMKVDQLEAKLAAIR